MLRVEVFVNQKRIGGMKIINIGDLDSRKGLCQYSVEVEGEKTKTIATHDRALPWFYLVYNSLRMFLDQYERDK